MSRVVTERCKITNFQVFYSRDFAGASATSLGISNTETRAIDFEAFLRRAKHLLNFQDGRGDTPIIAAVKFQRLDLCEVLLFLGAEPSQVAYDLSKDLGFSEISSLLRTWMNKLPKQSAEMPKWASPDVAHLALAR